MSHKSPSPSISRGTPLAPPPAACVSCFESWLDMLEEYLRNGMMERSKARMAEDNGGDGEGAGGQKKKKHAKGKGWPLIGKVGEKLKKGKVAPGTVGGRVGPMAYFLAIEENGAASLEIEARLQAVDDGTETERGSVETRQRVEGGDERRELDALSETQSETFDDEDNNGTNPIAAAAESHQPVPAGIPIISLSLHDDEPTVLADPSTATKIDISGNLVTASSSSNLPFPSAQESLSRASSMRRKGSISRAKTDQGKRGETATISDSLKQDTLQVIKHVLDVYSGDILTIEAAAVTSFTSSKPSASAASDYALSETRRIVVGTNARRRSIQGKVKGHVWWGLRNWSRSVADWAVFGVEGGKGKEGEEGERQRRKLREVGRG